MKRYVLGFLFPDPSSVALIEKTHPEWQKGRWNGVGGAIEGAETPHACMVRECEEETGAYIEKWMHFATLYPADATVFCFCAVSRDAYDAETRTDEKVGFWPIDLLPDNVLPNLRWLIPMALSLKDDAATRFEVTEIYEEGRGRQLPNMN